MAAKGYTQARLSVDDINDKQFQKIKLVSGLDGQADDVSVGSGFPVAVTNIPAVDTLGLPGVARQLNAGSASANTALTTTIRRVSLFARNADIRYSVGSTSQTASATSHFIGQNERIDIDVPATPNIGIIRAGATDGILELTELL